MLESYFKLSEHGTTVQREILAGASLPVGAGVANVVDFAGVSLATAVDMAVAHPASLLGIDPGGLVAGARADLIVFDLTEDAAADCGRFKVHCTVGGGEVVWGTPWLPA